MYSPGISGSAGDPMVDSLLDGKSSSRPFRRGGGRLLRTILLGTVAVAFAIFWLARSYGAGPAELLGYLGASVLFVAVFALIGILASLLLRLLRRPRGD
jgi:formate hydrogenlyase subunit 3/multisubunit Na+/H+ antiporter MnhD subunit